jgi:hypothetical protein
MLKVNTVLFDIGSPNDFVDHEFTKVSAANRGELFRCPRLLAIQKTVHLRNTKSEVARTTSCTSDPQSLLMLYQGMLALVLNATISRL